MNDIESEIMTFLNKPGKAAPEITHALKYIGGGSMQAGISKLMEYTRNSGIATGFFGGIAITSIIFILKEIIQKNRRLKAEGDTILQGLKDGFSDYKEKIRKSVICISEKDSGKFNMHLADKDTGEILYVDAREFENSGAAEKYGEQCLSDIISGMKVKDDLSNDISDFNDDLPFVDNTRLTIRSQG